MVETIIHGNDHTGGFGNTCLHVSEMFPLVLSGLSWDIQWLEKEQD